MLHFPPFNIAVHCGKMSQFEAMCEEYGACVRKSLWGADYTIFRKEFVEDGSGCNVTVREDGAEGGMATYFVDHDQLREPHVRDSYEEVQLSPEKIDCNRIFAQCAANADTPCVVALDTSVGITSAMLAVSGFEKEQLLVPNPDESEAPPDHLCTFFPCTFFELLRDYMYPNRDKYRGEYSVFLDYCCTWRGCKTGTRPQLDLKLLFTCGIVPKTEGVVAMSLSTRGYSGTRDHHAYVVDQEARKIARENGYDLRLKYVRSSSSQRVQFFLWETQEVPESPARIWVNAGHARGQNGPWLRGSVLECEGDKVTVQDTLGYMHRGAQQDARFLCTDKTCPIPTRMNNMLKELFFYDQN